MRSIMKMKLKKTMNLTRKDEPGSNSKLKIPSGTLEIPTFLKYRTVIFPFRWRKITDASGNETTQSNARIVKWSDGTQSLIVGNEKFGKSFYHPTEK